jgi:hypothetical protein
VMPTLTTEVLVNRPTDPADSNTERLLREVVRLDAITIGIAFGVLGGWCLFFATLWLVLKGGSEVGPHLSLLVNYFPGYRVSVFGSFIGFGYGFACGFIGGSLVAWLYNHIVRLRGR